MKLDTVVRDYVVFDLETTGTGIDFDEVIEISAVKVKDGLIVDEFTTLVNPGMHIPGEATVVNGISDDMVAGSPDFKKALGDFLKFAGENVLVGHNIANFDMKFISRDALKYWNREINNDYIDTLPLSRKYLPKLPKHRLTDLAEYYGISPEGAHRALNDCRMNQKVYEKLVLEIQHPSKEAINVPVCPKCGSILKKRSGRFGEFWGCTGYPDCRFTRNI